MTSVLVQFVLIFTQPTYRVTQQCCPGGNGPETPRRPDIFGKITGKFRQNFQKKKNEKKKRKNLKILSGFASDLAEISGEPPEAPVMIGPS